jgi:hypothetical protein
LREFPQAHLLIVGDPEVYALFEGLPEGQRQYLPAVGPEDFPYLLRQVDVLLLPYRASRFNGSLSDRLLVQGGALRIPWVGSRLPALVAWESGGLVANTADDWHPCLRQLVLDADLRCSLGEAGRTKAEAREIGRLAQAWMEAGISAARRCQARLGSPAGG